MDGSFVPAWKNDLSVPISPCAVTKTIATANGIAVTEEQIRAKMDELMVQAIAQVKAGN